MQPLQLLTTFFFLLIALFLKEVVTRLTRPLFPTRFPREIRYFDFVRNTLFSFVSNNILRIIVFPLVYGISHIWWLWWIWTYFESFDKIVVLDFFSFLGHFWLMLFIAISVFVTYWVFGLLSLVYYGHARAQGKEMPYNDKDYTPKSRDQQKKYWCYYRLLPWSVLFILTLHLWYFLL